MVPPGRSDRRAATSSNRAWRSDATHSTPPLSRRQAVRRMDCTRNPLSMPHKLLSPLALALALLVVSGFAFPGAGSGATAVDAFGTSVPGIAAPTHVLKIEYQQGRGALRAAQITLQPESASASPLWSGELGSIHILTTERGWIIIESMQIRRGGIQARAMLPPADQLVAILFRPERGEGVAWRFNPDARGYTEVEWTFYNQRGQVVGDSKDAPEDPDEPEDPKDPDAPEEPEDPPSDTENCTAPPCSGIVDPWTCECEEDIRDPWGSESSDGNITLMM